VEDQAQIERTDVNQQSFKNVPVTSEMGPSHSASIIAMCKASLDQLAALP